MIFTPRGLKVRLPINLVFALIDRLSPKVSAFRVLQTTEAFEILPTTCSFIATIILFITNQQPFNIVIIVSVVQILLNFYCLSGLNLGIGLLIQLARYFSILSGYGVYYLILFLIGWFTIGWQGIVAYIIGRIISGILNIIFNSFYLNRVYKKQNINLTLSEMNFFNSYRFYAKKLGVSTNISVKDEELVENNWYDTYKKLEIDWPEVVQRFYT